MMERIAAEVEVDGRMYSLVVTTGGRQEEYAWYHGHCFTGAATALEVALGLALEKTRKKLVRVLCEKDQGKDCFECPEETCAHYWGPNAFQLPFQVRPDESEDVVMPSKKDLKKAERKGYQPYAIAQSMVNKGKIPASKKEHAVKSITKSVIKGKGGGKAHKASGKKCK